MFWSRVEDGEVGGSEKAVCCLESKLIEDLSEAVLSEQHPKERESSFGMNRVNSIHHAQSYTVLLSSAKRTPRGASLEEPLHASEMHAVRGACCDPRTVIICLDMIQTNGTDKHQTWLCLLNSKGKLIWNKKVFWSRLEVGE